MVVKALDPYAQRDDACSHAFVHPLGALGFVFFRNDLFKRNGDKPVEKSLQKTDLDRQILKLVVVMEQFQWCDIAYCLFGNLLAM